MNKAAASWLSLAVLAVLGLLAGVGQILEHNFAGDRDGAAPDVIPVDSGADHGPGSLRSALFAAMRSPHFVTIEVNVPVIDLDVPLPPVTAPAGARIAGTLNAPSVLRYRADAGQPAIAVLQLAGSSLALDNLLIDANGGIGVNVTGDRASLDGVSIEHGESGLVAIDVDRLSVRQSHFEDNAEGLRIQGSGGTASIRSNTFRNNLRSAIWIALNVEPVDATPDILIHDNILRGGLNGIVASNAAVDVRGNEVAGFKGIGAMVLNSRAVIANNRLLDNPGTGLHLTGLRDSFVMNNEIGFNSLVGILVLDARGLQVNDNKLYGNGYGIAVVGRQPTSAALHNNTLVNQSLDGLISIGDSPLMNGNHVSRNQHAGIRILDLLLPDRPLIRATPRLAGNVVSGNGDDTVQRGRYVVSPP